MKRKVIIILMMLIPFLRSVAQISEIEQIYRSSNHNYIQYTSIVRNYDSIYNVLMMYGWYTNTIYDDSIKAHSSFMVQNTNTGYIEHIVNLPKGYQVNDIRFVTLRKIDGETTEDFCVFCGTRTHLDDILCLPALPGEPTQYEYVYSKHGFAGFFSMEDALNPTTSHSAKVRDVEQTRELYRMVCYAEQQGHYYQNQTSFLDNAVLDIIGLDDIVYAPSCFCRAKFYPDYNGGVLWDNNMRYNLNEVLTDITLTDDYVVTSSNSTTGNTQWLRYSGKEDHHVPGGLELNTYVNSIDFTSLILQLDCNVLLDIDRINRINPAKICHVRDNEIEICYYMLEQRNYGGLLNSRYKYQNGTLLFLQGAYMKCSPLVKELIHMPSNNSTAVLLNESYSEMVSVLTWNIDQYCTFPVRQFMDNDIKAQSVTLQKRNGYEHLFWSGKDISNTYSPMYLMSQRGSLGGGYENTCHYEDRNAATPFTIKHSTIYNPLPIRIRYPYDSVTYPVLYLLFTPFEIEKEFPCVNE